MSDCVPLTKEEFQLALPDKMKKSVNTELMDNINKTLSDPDFYEDYRENLLSYAHVVRDGKFSVEQYLNAVKYVSHKLMGRTNIDAYSRTFPDKITRFKTNGVTDKDIASYVTAYNKSKLVNLIFEQTLIPTYVLNQDLYQKALNVQAELMVTANSELVRTQAANSLLTQLKPPETKKVELNLGNEEHSSIAALRQATMELAALQRQQIASGMSSAQQIAHSKIGAKIEEAEYEEISK